MDFFPSSSLTTVSDVDGGLQVEVVDERLSVETASTPYLGFLGGSEAASSLAAGPSPSAVECAIRLAIDRLVLSS